MPPPQAKVKKLFGKWTQEPEGKVLGVFILKNT